MKLVTIVFLLSALSVVPVAHTQGFVNLDFEGANVFGSSSGSVLTSNAIPGWKAYISGVSQSTMLYNDVTLGEAAVSLQDGDGIYQPIQGQYFVLLQATYFASYTHSAAIGQTGTIPINAQSLVFYGNISLSGVANNMQITFNENLLNYSEIGTGGNYTIYGADISAYAGQTGPLLFTAFNNTYAAIDNIQFSSSAIPEPSMFSLVGLGLLGLGWHRRQNHRT